MVKGEETAHLRQLLRVADAKGSDVRLCSQTILDGSRQEFPYPAFAWSWTSIQCYPWKQRQHINILEFIAFFNYFREVVKYPGIHGHRLFHILDSRVSSCVATKGRSSSKALNRPLRRFAAFALASDCYVHTLWTLSKWNYSDTASRLWSQNNL